jgi:chorismate mutase
LTDRQAAAGNRLLALRGATTVANDDPEAIAEATRELLEALFERNGAAPDDVVSMIFTATPDLTAEFPAVAARRVARPDVPVLCATEIAVRGALQRCIRVLVHLYSDRPRDSLRHVYLGEARSLRADLPE